MKKPLYIVGIVLFCSFTFLFCQKKLFKNVEVHGRVINYITGAPEQAGINLYGNAGPSDQNSIDMVRSHTYGDGTFYIKSKAAESEVYYLQVLPTSSTGLDTNIVLKDGQNVDIGNFLAGSYTFFCRVTIIPVTGSAIDIGNSHYTAGTSTQFMLSSTMNIDTYTALNHMYVLVYKTYPAVIAKDSSIYVPIHSTDTLNCTIYY